MILDFTAIDFETAYYRKESACSIGLVRFRDGEAVDSFYSLIRPPSLYVRPDFTAIHGLTVADLTDAPTFDRIWPQVRDFIGDLPLTAHNARFDRSVLQQSAARYGIRCPDYPFYCSCLTARRALPGGPHRLTALADRYGIVYDAHNALADAETCGRLFVLFQQAGTAAVRG